MPIHIGTVTIHFKDEDGQPVDDATFTIRKHLSHEAQMDYLEAAADFDVNPETGEVKTTMQKLKLKQVTAIMLSDALLSWTGVLDDLGNQLSVQDYQRVDAPFLGQITAEIQRRNTPASKGAGPKGDAPSDSSSKGTARTR